MRRGGPPVLPVDAAAVPAFSRVERGPRGLRLAPAAPPAGAADDGGPPLRLRAGAPVAVRDAVVVAGGRLVLATAAGVAYTLSAPQMQVIDRRPPGLDAAIGAPLANAGLLRAGDGWRAVVLPSLGDVAASLGPGPVAVRADGRRIAAAVDGGVEEWDLGTPDPVARHDGVPAALCYAGDGTLLAACGSRAARAGRRAGRGLADRLAVRRVLRAARRRAPRGRVDQRLGVRGRRGHRLLAVSAGRRRRPGAVPRREPRRPREPPSARTPAPAWRARRTARSCARSPAPAPSPRPRPRTAASSAATGAAPG